MKRMSEFNFLNERGVQLAGRLEMPTSPNGKVAIFAHCFSCSKNVHAATRVSRELAKLGIAVLRFDFTGLGNSEGDFANTNFTSNVGDLVAAADALRERFQAPSLLIGHSLGGAAVLMAAGQIEEVKAVATIGAPSEPAHVSHLFGDKMACIEQDGAALIQIGGRELRIEKHFQDDLKTHRLTKMLPTLRKPVMIFHSPVDAVVSIDHARMLYDHARHPKSFISLDDADHMLTRQDDAEFVASTLAAWASRYVTETVDADEQNNIRRVADGIVEVTEQASSLKQLICTSQHVFFSDEPALVTGGSGAGPDPYELLLASLGACTSMTLRMYANRKQWPVRGIQVVLSHSRTKAEDVTSDDNLVDVIERQITVTGDLEETQLARLEEIANRCPVHRTLLNEKRISTKIHLV